MQRLEAEVPKAAAVRLRLWAGLSVGRAAGMLGISERTAERMWADARAGLLRGLREGA
ncbi:MAG: hypothetical protein JSR77_10575 [Planctomycetes bacterium]|nr:hypothetical protein [Planctomycetota bacterium]